MLKHILLREEDYWLIPLSAFAVLLVGMFLYAEVTYIRLLSGLFGFLGLWLTTYVIRRGYSNKRASTHLLICLVFAIALAYGLYLLTN